MAWNAVRHGGRQEEVLTGEVWGTGALVADKVVNVLTQLQPPNHHRVGSRQTPGEWKADSVPGQDRGRADQVPIVLVKAAACPVGPQYEGCIPDSGFSQRAEILAT